MHSKSSLRILKEKTKVARHVHLRGVTGAIRTGSFDNREHLVVPVVALVEGVVFASNADHPELVLASELGVAPQGWDGRPVVNGHPIVDGNPVSANSPLILEKYKFGQLFNTRLEGVRLQTEAWIDPTLVSRLPPDGQRTVERLKAGEQIEVSVGAFILKELTLGEFKGKKYGAIWRNIIPDHLAFLGEGDIGACSVADGCGAPRIASVHLITDEGIQIMEDDKVDEPTQKGFVSWLRELIKNETSASVIVTSTTTGTGTAEPRAACNCNQKGDGKMDKAQRIKALIDNPKTPWSAADQTYLESQSDDRLTALETHAAEVSKVEEPKVEPKVEPVVEEKKEPVAAQTVEQYIAAAPPQMQESLREGFRANQERRASVIASLKATNRCDHTDAELNAMTTDGLAKLLKLAAVPPPATFEGVNLPRKTELKVAEAPPSLIDRVRTSRGAK